MLTALILTSLSQGTPGRTPSAAPKNCAEIAKTHRVMSANNALCNVKLGAWLQALIPYTSWPQVSMCICVCGVCAWKKTL